MRVSVLGGGEFAHQGIDLAGGNRHNNSLDGADFFVRDILCPGHAKVVHDSWLALPGYCRSQSDHCRGAGIELLFVANSIVEIAVGFMLFGWQHQLMLFSCEFWISIFPVVCVTNCPLIFNNFKKFIVLKCFEKVRKFWTPTFP